jgi:hypothetical protein
VARQQDNGLGVAGSVWIDRNTVMGALTPRKALAAELLPLSAIGGELLAADDRRGERLSQRLEPRRLIDGRTEHRERSMSFLHQIESEPKLHADSQSKTRRVAE